MARHITVTSKQFSVPNRVIPVGKVRLAYAAALAVLLASTAALFVPRVAQAVSILKETDQPLAATLDVLAENVMHLGPALIWCAGVVVMLANAISGWRCLFHQGVPAKVSIEIPALHEQEQLPRFLEHRELQHQEITILKRLLIKPLIPSYEFLPIAHRYLLRSFKLKHYLVIGAVLCIPFLLQASGLVNFAAASFPVIAVAATLLGTAALIVAIRLSGDHRPQIDVHLERVHNRSSGNPTSFFYGTEDLLQDRAGSEFRNLVYHRAEPQVGRTSAGETNMFDARLVVETYPHNIEAEVRRPATFLLASGLVFSLGAFVVALLSPLLWAPSLPNAIVALGTFLICFMIGTQFRRHGEFLVHTYRFESAVFHIWMKGTYGSTYIDSDPAARVKGRRTMLDSEVRCEVWSARLISESINLGHFNSPRVLIDARDSAQFASIRETLLGHLRTSQFFHEEMASTADAPAE